MRVRIPRRPPRRTGSRSRRQVDRASLVDPRRHRSRAQRSGRGSGFSRCPLDRCGPGGGQPQGSTCTPRVVFERCRRCKGHGSTWNVRVAESVATPLEVEGEGRSGLVQPRTTSTAGTRDLDPIARRAPGARPRSAPCSPAMRASDRAPWSASPHPLRAMGASDRDRRTARHRSAIDGGGLSGHRPTTAPVPTAQVKSAVLLAGLAADGITTGHRSRRHPRSHRASDPRAWRPRRGLARG